MRDLPEIQPDELMQRDVSRLIGQRRRLGRMKADDAKRQRQLEEFAAGLEASAARCRARRENLPGPDYDPDLPIA